MKKMKWLDVMAVGAGLIALPLAAHAADESPWYGGIGLGHSDVKRPGSWAQQADIALRPQGVTSVTTISSGNTSWKVFGGYQFNESFGIEAAYARLGKFGGTSAVTAPAAGTGTGTWDASAFSVAAVGYLPVHENRVYAFGKLGVAYTHLGVSVVAPNGAGSAVFSPVNDRGNLMLGFGMRFDLTKKVGLRAEWEHFNNVGDGSSTGQSAIDIWSISAQYRF